MLPLINSPRSYYYNNNNNNKCGDKGKTVNHISKYCKLAQNVLQD